MSFSLTLLHARKSRANSEISELLPDGPGAALGGSVGFGLPHGLETGREAAAEGVGAFGHPHSWPYAAGDNSRRRVSLLTHEYAGTLWSNVGPNISRSAGPHDSWRPRGQLAAVALPWTSFLVRASTRIPERPHTMFRLLNIFLASSVLGRTARTSHNGEPSLRQSLCTECTGSPAAEVGLDFVYREVGRNAADNGL
ncbi:hypothetical protein EVAR_12562_1 [Eumeta japonica]|uniref:Uncharacterized protein n=1 Tax=Eumeta variegata TaxID=151549 RepID=A0A4C1UEU0_EUMVA|nr:hypothetical protein EVAR_12562_1 [Eumeta japonica]